MEKKITKTTEWLTRRYTEEELAKMKEEALKEAEVELQKKQIEEMQKDIMENTAIYDSDVAQDVAETLVYKGYRKQKEGEWEIVKGSNGQEKMFCTNCQHGQDLHSTFTYCPNCGARMHGAKRKGVTDGKAD